jgi:hypothetical protein
LDRTSLLPQAGDATNNQTTGKQTNNRKKSMSKQNLQSTAEKIVPNSADQISEEQLHTVTGGATLDPKRLDAIAEFVSVSADLNGLLSDALGKKPGELDAKSIRSILANPPDSAKNTVNFILDNPPV